MSTSLAPPVVGRVVGGYFGYPQLGAMAGAMIGSAVDPTTIQGPRINEAGNQTVAEGVPRTVVYGTLKCTGNVIQRGPLVKVETSTSQGKGSTKVESEKALRTYAIGICEGPIALQGLLRVWRNKKLVYDVTPGSGMVQESTKWIENRRFYTGDETQLPDPDLELLDPDATAHRGSCYMVFIDDDVTDFQGAIPQYEFEVARNVAANVLTLPRVVVGSRELSGITGGGTFTDLSNGVDVMAPPGDVWLAMFQLGNAAATPITLTLWVKINGGTIWSQVVTIPATTAINPRVQLNIPAGASTVQTGFIGTLVGTLTIAVKAVTIGDATYKAYAPPGATVPNTYGSDSQYFGIVTNNAGTLYSMS